MLGPRTVKSSWSVALLLAVACGDSTGPGGTGGGGGEGGVGGTGGSSNTTPFASCDDVTPCEPSPDVEENARNSCVECAVLGDDSTAPDGGTCAAAYNACFGPADNCTDPGSEPDCCAFYDCLALCDTDESGDIDEGELGCFCTTELNAMKQLVCAAEQLPGSCIEDHRTGFDLAFAYEDCVFGITGPGVCAQTCN